jgi:hypothetical protein
MKNYLKIVAGIALFVAIAVGGLTLIRNFNRQPSVILTSDECSPPCWNGIEPGKTKSWEVYAILEQLGGVNKDSIMVDYGRSNEELTEIYWFFQRPVEDSAGSIYFENDRVTTINILTVNSLNLDDLFEKLGQPEKYWTEIGHGENREFLKVSMFYPTNGYLADVVIDIESGVNQVEIQGTTPVFRVTYFAPEMFQELLETQILIDKPIPARTGSFQAWSGFGAIKFQRK